MQFLRKILFYLFAAVYIILCPLLIMYALGYIYRPGPGAGVVRTGLIYLSSAPTGADVYLNGGKYPETTPTVMQELEPGEYSVRLDLKGYRQWDRKVPVQPEKATVLDKVILIPEEQEGEEISGEVFSDIVPVPGSGFFIARKGPNMGDLVVCSYRQEKVSALSSGESQFDDYQARSVFTSGKSPYVLIEAKEAQDKRTFWAGLSGGSSAIKDVTALTGRGFQDVLWRAGQGQTVFVLREGSLDRIDMDAGAVYPGYINNIKGAGLYQDKVYYITRDNELTATGYDKKGARKILDDPSLGQSLFGGAGLFKIIVLSDEYILFLSANGELLSNRLPYRLVGKGVRGVEYFAQGQKALVWTAERVGVVDFALESTGDVDFEKGVQVSWAYTGGKDLSQCFWVFSGSHVLFRDGVSIELLAIEEYGQTHANNIMEVKEGSSIFYSDQTGKVYYVDPDDGALKSDVLVPHKSLISVPFPKMPSKDQDAGRGGAS